MNRRLKIMLALPFFLILVSLGGAKMVNFESRLTAEESELLAFEPEEEKLLRTRTGNEAAGRYQSVESPIKLLKKKAAGIKREGVGTEKAKLASKKKEKPSYHLSMIIISEKRKVAVINDRLVNEYDLMGNVRIARIDKDRVLLKQNKSAWWEYLKEKK